MQSKHSTSSRSSPSYGVRGRQDTANSGIRRTAPTFGKARFGTYSRKAGGHLVVESDQERLVTQLLTIDPRVRAFQTQPFTVDLIGQRLLLDAEAVSEARQKYRGAPGPIFYTPDISVDWGSGLHQALEVKFEGYEGDDEYQKKIARARPILDAYGYPLKVVTVPADRRHPVRLNTPLLKQAEHRVRTLLTSELVARVTDRCEAGPVLARMLCMELDLPAGLVPVLLVAGVLCGDIAHEPVSGTLSLSLAEGDLSHLYLLEGIAK